MRRFTGLGPGRRVLAFPKGCRQAGSRGRLLGDGVAAAGPLLPPAVSGTEAPVSCLGRLSVPTVGEKGRVCRRMPGALGLALLVWAGAAGLSGASGFTENGLSLLSYQLCEYPVTRRVRKVEAVRTSRVVHASCGGWIPWRRCPKTVYQTRYLAVEVPEAQNVTDCCEGHEQLGLYCVLPLNRSSEFASRPGVCPAAEPAPEPPSSPCGWDTDCPGLWKCCPWSGGHRCTAPATPGAAAERSLANWYNVTVLVKMDFQDLQQVDPGLRNHTRLLYSLVASALQPLQPAVHYLRSAGGDAFTTASWLLLGLPRPRPPADVSALLDDMVKRVYEVVSVRVQDVDECLHAELRTCSEAELCRNVEGSHLCVRAREPPNAPPQRPNHTDTGDAGGATWAGVSGVGSPPLRVPGGVLWVGTSTASSDAERRGRRSDRRVRDAPGGCQLPLDGRSTLLLPEDLGVHFWGSQPRPLRESRCHAPAGPMGPMAAGLGCLAPALANAPPPGLVILLGSTQNLGSQQPRRFHPCEAQVSSCQARGESRIAGTRPSPAGDGPGLLGRVGSPDHRPGDTRRLLRDDCGVLAALPRRHGSSILAAAGDAMNATGSGLSTTTGVTVPALDDGTTVLSPESSTSPPSPGPPQGTPATGQAQTRGPPSKRGADDVDSHDRNSTRLGVGEEGPSVAPSDGSTRGAGSTTPPPGAPASPRGLFPHETTPGAPDTPAQVPGNATTEPPSWPATNATPGHIVWHIRLPSLQTEKPTPSPTPGLPSAPRPAPGQPPACGPPGAIGRVVVSDVTSTGFRLRWEAEPGPLPDFHLTVGAAHGPAVRVETRNTSAVLSGLRPGVLHLVQITARACGKEGARTDLKVRTVAQKLQGKVKIANVRYSEAFQNTSSQEYRDFLRLFLSAVREPLPVALGQHMDTGGIRLHVTGITNGSVVVDFTLLVIADVDLREVSAAFLAALHNASQLEVVRDHTFIQDFDECASGEDDCVPGTACRNTLGSFTCSCEGGASSFLVEYSGRPCEGASPGSAPQGPGPAQPPTPAGPGAAPRGPLPRLTLTDAVDVRCEVEKVAIAIHKRFLQQESIPESALYLGQPSCNASDSNGTHVFLVAGWGECGTLVQSNMTSTVVRTTLRSDLSPEGVIHHPKILSPIRCAFRNDLLASSGYAPQWGVYTIVEDLHGAGNFITEMQVFVGDSPVPQNYSVSASDDVKIEVGLYRQKSNLRVVLVECWATPSSDARDPVTFGFINNSCPVPNTYTSVIQNGDSSKAQFKLRIFSFINNSIVYLHCKLRVCLENPGASCKISCSDFRLASPGEASALHQMSWGPLLRSEGEPRPPAVGGGAGVPRESSVQCQHCKLESAGELSDPGKHAGGRRGAGGAHAAQAARGSVGAHACSPSPCGEPGPGAGLILPAALAVLAVLGAAAALLLLRYQRSTGSYRLPAPAGGSGYRVFYD
ncbi:uromodulin-like 1 [Perognathus longimembris pacificus]|uniref:uromodulin-like 1 n=1 Tax=Perognathus longimembris pacificus TaxID=214514 RepID=UPI0020196E17|nr:uromodulin-like 1 [Perognathus longimembris pacificus]